MIQSARKERKNKRYNGDFGNRLIINYWRNYSYFIQANNDPLDEFQCSIENICEVTAIM